ncbi:MAG TPA: hypothetical protein VEB22_12565 [Phycisphaerales bacterium]|nr:hypothetical protein [Phycisphaerales bacterium]
MMSPFAFLRRWSVNLLAWCALVACAAAMGVKLQVWTAVCLWVALAALLCAAGALLIRSQPVGTPTMFGRIGYLVTHFGFRAGHGRLPFAAAVSWCVWSVVGLGAIWVAVTWWTPIVGAMALSWVVDVLALLFLWGIVLQNRPRPGAGGPPAQRAPGAVVKLSGLGVAVLTVSAALWWLVGTPAAQFAALAIAAGPLVVVGGGYGLFMLALLTVGRNVRWN